MQSSESQWILTAGELESLFLESGRKRGPLSAMPEGAATEEDRGHLRGMRSELDSDQATMLDACLDVLASPDRVVQLHYSLGDRQVSRSTMAASGSLPGLWVALGGSVDPLSLSTRSEAELRFLVANVLGAMEAEVSPTKLGCDLSTDGALALLAVLDQVRRAWMVSLIRHLEPVDFFTLSDIADRLAEGSINDFRWALPLVEKLIPVPFGELSVVKDPRPALEELIQAGIIRTSDVAADVFELSEAGERLADIHCGAGIRMAVSSAYLADSGQVACDVHCFIRSARDLLCIVMSGPDAAVSTLLPADLQHLLDLILIGDSEFEDLGFAGSPDDPARPDEPPNQDPSDSGSAAASEKVRAPDADNPVTARAKPTPRATEPSTCPGCRQPVSPTARFCGSCGAKL